MSVYVNVSSGGKYLTQRDNEERPLETCGPTSLAMALSYSGIEFPSIPEGEQPEDSLTRFLANDLRVRNYYKQNYTALFNAKTPANEVHDVAAMGVNLWAAADVCRFSTRVPLQRIVYQLHTGYAVPVSGVWAGLRHIVCTVGFESDQDFSLVDGPDAIDVNLLRSFVIDDPYGDYRTQYRNKNGNDIPVSREEYLDIVRERGRVDSKWAYILTRP